MDTLDAINLNEQAVTPSLAGAVIVLGVLPYTFDLCTGLELTRNVCSNTRSPLS